MTHLLVYLDGLLLGLQMYNEIRYLQYDEDTKAILGFLVHSDNLPSNTYEVTLDFLNNVNRLGHTHISINDDDITSYKGKDTASSAFIAKTRRLQYENVSDPLFMEWQFALATGSANAEEYRMLWIESVQTIKNNNPKEQ